MTFVFFRSYVRQHRLWTIQIVVAIVALLLLVPVAWFLYRTPITDVTVNVHSSGNAVHTIDMVIRRTRTSRDHLELVLATNTAAIHESRPLRVTVSGRFDYVGQSDGWHVVTRQSGQETVCELRPRAGARPTTARLAFDGRVYRRSAAIDMHVGIFAFRDDREVSSVPTKLVISGLDGMSIDQLLPEPTHKAVREIVYERAPWRDVTTRDGFVALRATDRRLAARDQFWLFIVAALFGTFVSAVVGLLQTLIQVFENERTKVSTTAALDRQ